MARDLRRNGVVMAVEFQCPLCSKAHEVQTAAHSRVVACACGEVLTVHPSVPRVVVALSVAETDEERERWRRVEESNP